MAQTLSDTTRRAIIARITEYETLPEDQKIAQVVRVISNDFYFYCERNLEILDKLSGEVVPFVLNWAQKLLVARVVDDIAHGRPVRYIILKARQMGLSTVIEALCYWWTTTHRNIKSVIIAHETEASGNLYDMFKRYFDNSNVLFQPTRKYNNKKELVFDVEDNVKEQIKKHASTCTIPEHDCKQAHRSPGLSSSIKTLVAKDGKGRSSTIHFFHGSEVAFWEAKADVVSAALQAVPMHANTFVFLESTANGVGGYFYLEWQLAMKGESPFTPLFFAWHEHAEYEIRDPRGCAGVYDEEETALLEVFEEKGYPRESWDWKILWRREKKKEFRSDPRKFYQEYPSTDMEAFLQSGRPKFDVAMLVRMEQYAIKNGKHTFGQVTPNENPLTKESEKFVFQEVPVVFQGQDPTPLKVWELPVKANPTTHTPAAQYIIGVDVSEGKLVPESEKKENDYSVVDVMRRDTLKTVARWRGHIDPDLLGAVVFALGTFYNEALVGVEINNHGLTTVQSLRNKFYRNLFMRKNNEENLFQERTSLMGWRTDRKTKPKIINNLQAAIRDGDIIDLDVVFIRECMTYVIDDQGFTSAQESMFDDTVMAKAICLQMANYNSISVQHSKDHIHKPKKRNTNATNTTSLETIAAGKARSNGTYREVIQRRRAAREAYRASRRQR